MLIPPGVPLALRSEVSQRRKEAPAEGPPTSSPRRRSAIGRFQRVGPDPKLVRHAWAQSLLAGIRPIDLASNLTNGSRTDGLPLVTAALLD